VELLRDWGTEGELLSPQTWTWTTAQAIQATPRQPKLRLFLAQTTTIMPVFSTNHYQAFDSMDYYILLKKNSIILLGVRGIELLWFIKKYLLDRKQFVSIDDLISSLCITFNPGCPTGVNPWDIVLSIIYYKFAFFHHMKEILFADDTLYFIPIQICIFSLIWSTMSLKK
jgi:hypothetical protein